MQVVIDIDENVYTRLFDNGTDFYDTDDILAMAKAIRKGTVLPKGHGRLIDADAVLVEPFGNTYKDIDIAETIIEADKEYEVEVITRGNCMICGKELSDGIFFCKECEEKGRKRG